MQKIKKKRFFKKQNKNKTAHLKNKPSIHLIPSTTLSVSKIDCYSKCAVHEI